MSSPSANICLLGFIWLIIAFIAESEREREIFVACLIYMQLYTIMLVAW